MADQPMTADHAYMIVASNLAAGVAANDREQSWTARTIYNEYV